jgi:hypothetical protein
MCICIASAQPAYQPLRRICKPEVAVWRITPATTKALVRAVLGQGFFFVSPRLLTELLTSSNDTG